MRQLQVRVDCCRGRGRGDKKQERRDETGRSDRDLQNERDKHEQNCDKTGASSRNSPPNGAINIHVGGNGGEGNSSPGPAGNSSKNELRNWLTANKPPNERALKLMTVSDVVTFLKSMNLNVLAAACKRDLDGSAAVITRQQLDELQLGTTIHRCPLMMLIDRYRSQSGDGVDMHNKTWLSAPNSPRDGSSRQRKVSHRQ